MTANEKIEALNAKITMLIRQQVEQAKRIEALNGRLTPPDTPDAEQEALEDDDRQRRDGRGPAPESRFDLFTEEEDWQSLLADLHRHLDPKAAALSEAQRLVGGVLSGLGPWDLPNIKRHLGQAVRLIELANSK